MRIALMHPTFWPEVRRGSERVVAELGAALAERGHDVTVLTSHRHPGSVSREGELAVDRAWRPPSVRPLRFYEHYVETIPAAIRRLSTGGFDIAHAFFPTDAYAAARCTARGGPPFVFSIHGIPTREYLVARRYRLEMLTRAIGAAGELTALSEAAAEPVRRYLLREPVVVPGGVDPKRFAANGERAAKPTLICASSLADPRKRGALLVEAFSLLRERIPEARLVLAGGADMPGYGADELGLPDGVIRLLPAGTDALAAAYATAWATVLPSVEEAFGLVVLESLAAGTPVVGARSGAIPELLTEGQHGVLFEPDDPSSLAEAMAVALDLGFSEEAVSVRTRRAAEFAWPRIAAEVEGIYSRLLVDSPTP
jgi:phosphatidylinositol alpha-mannosyltransferase